MRVRHVVPFLLLVVALVPDAAAGAACPPLDCGPAGVTVAGGKLLAVTAKRSTALYDLRTGRARPTIYNAVFSADGRRAATQDGGLVRTIDLASGRTVFRFRVAIEWSLAGVSSDGARVVLLRTKTSSTDVLVRTGVKAQNLHLAGKFDFDGILGSRLYLIEQQVGGYLVRVADLDTGTLAPAPLKDADEPALISGQAWSRVASPDGRYLFTVYVTGNGTAMIHELDMRDAKAWCVDLPGTGDFNAAGSYAIALSADARQLYAVAAAYGKLVTIDVASHRVATTTSFAASRPSQPSIPSATLAPDGEHLAFSNAGTGWVFELASGRVVKRMTLPAVQGVLAYAPSDRLWFAKMSGRATRVAT